jgi:hypothetical protein
MHLTIQTPCPNQSNMKENDDKEKTEAGNTIMVDVMTFVVPLTLFCWNATDTSITPHECYDDV